MRSSAASLGKADCRAVIARRLFAFSGFILWILRGFSPIRISDRSVRFVFRWLSCDQREWPCVCLSLGAGLEFLTSHIPRQQLTDVAERFPSSVRSSYQSRAGRQLTLYPLCHTRQEHAHPPSSSAPQPRGDAPEGERGGEAGSGRRTNAYSWAFGLGMRHGRGVGRNREGKRRGEGCIRA